MGQPHIKSNRSVRSSVLFSCMTMDRGWRIVRGISLQGLRGHRRQETDRARWIRFVPFMLFIFSLISCFLFFGKKKGPAAMDQIHALLIPL